jgi:hypothetical protein
MALAFAALLQQSNEMNRCSIETYALLWVVGPPGMGMGKSCAALVFACSLDRSQWDVVWIHYLRHGEHFNCVCLHGDKKSTYVIKKEGKTENLHTSSERNRFEDKRRAGCFFRIAYNSKSFDQTFQGCRAKVMVIRVGYEINAHCPFEGSRVG